MYQYHCWGRVAFEWLPDSFEIVPQREKEVETHKGVMIKGLIRQRQKLIGQMRNLKIEIHASVIQ